MYTNLKLPELNHLNDESHYLILLYIPHVFIVDVTLCFVSSQMSDVRLHGSDGNRIAVATITVIDNKLERYRNDIDRTSYNNFEVNNSVLSVNKQELLNIIPTSYKSHKFILSLGLFISNLILDIITVLIRYIISNNVYSLLLSTYSLTFYY